MLPFDGTHCLYLVDYPLVIFHGIYQRPGTSFVRKSVPGLCCLFECFYAMRFTVWRILAKSRLNLYRTFSRIFFGKKWIRIRNIIVSRLIIMLSCKFFIICKNNANDVFVQTNLKIYYPLLDDCRKSVKFGLLIKSFKL